VDCVDQVGVAWVLGHRLDHISLNFRDVFDVARADLIIAEEAANCGVTGHLAA
jgi:hypothetical protein